MIENRWWLVIASGLAVFMVALDASIVTVALPTIGRDFRVPAAATAWVIIGYLLPMVALVLPAGRWLDRSGRRPAFLAGIAGFAVSSAAAGAAPGLGWLIAARMAQGVFGAILMAVIPALVTGAVRPEFRGRAMSVVATLGPIGAVTGPAVGGVLVAVVGWPSIFFVNVPVSVAVIAVAMRTVERGGGLTLPDGRWLAESALLAAAATALIGALSLVPSRGAPWLLGALVAVPLVAAWSRLRTSRPVVQLVRAPSLGGPILALLFSVAAVAGAQFIAPFYLQRALHASSAVTGLVVLVLPLGMAVTGPAAGYLADRWGGRRTTTVGTLVIAAGLALVAPLGAGWHPLDLAWRLGVVGIGLGLFVGPNSAVVMQQAPRHLFATTGGAIGLARSLAFALGPAIVAIPWALAAYSQAGMRTAADLTVGAAALGAAATLLGLARRRRPAPEMEADTEEAA
jgi:MFS family permease